MAKNSIAARVKKAQADMRAAAERYAKAASASANAVELGPYIPAELLARRRADSVLLAAARRARKPAKKRRSGKKKVSAAQRAARARFAAASRARGGKVRKAGKKRRTTKAKPARRPAARKTSKRKSKVTTVTAAQVIKMAQKGSLKKWLCGGVKRTGCGSTGRVLDRIR